MYKLIKERITMKIIVQHAKMNRETGAIEGFTDVAEVNASKFDNVDDALEYAYRYTNNVMGSWSIKEEFLGDHENGDYNEDVTVLHNRPDGMGQRSTMMMDRMIVNGETYKVAMAGFKKVELAA